jgi:hypothetical protein
LFGYGSCWFLLVYLTACSYLLYISCYVMLCYVVLCFVLFCPDV